MADNQAMLALKARFVFPVHGPPIADSCVTIRYGRIVAVGTSAPGCPTHDLGNAAILPGLVNAHTHLEFSDLAAPLGRPGMPLPDWIRQVFAHRRAVTSAATDNVKRGLRESLMAGTTLLGEIATSDWRNDVARAAETVPDTIMFHESIGPTLDRVASAMAAAEAFLAVDSPPSNIALALSPHAPYTVHPQLLAALVALGRQFNVPLAMHLAESREELEWIQTGGGPFGQLLRDLNAGDSSPESPFLRVLDYLQHLARAPRSLVIHGNYLNAADLDFIAANAATMSVVYCPRTHAFFGHEPYPLARLLTMGVAVALGTDSRASNPDLSVLAELAYVAQHYPQVPAAKVLELGTLAGARALGLDAHAGTLEPGKVANLTVVGLQGEADDPHQLVFDPSARVMQTWLRGVAFSTAGNS
jgi:aminodeoxyfutalosine deaminase